VPVTEGKQPEHWQGEALTDWVGMGEKGGKSPLQSQHFQKSVEERLGTCLYKVFKSKNEKSRNASTCVTAQTKKSILKGVSNRKGGRAVGNASSGKKGRGSSKTVRDSSLRWHYEIDWKDKGAV